MSFRLLPYTNKRQCIICGPTNTTDCLIAVNAAIRLHLFAERNIIVTGGLKICSHHICTNGTIDIIPANKGFVALGKKQRRRSHSNPARVFNPLEPSQQELQEFLHLLQKQHLVSLPTGGDSKESMRNRVQLEDFPDKSDALRSLFKAPSKGHIRALAEEMEAVELASASTSVASSTSKSASSCSTPSPSSTVTSPSLSVRKRGRPMGSFSHGAKYIDVVILFLLHIGLGLRCSAVAALQRLPVSTVRRQIQRTRQALADSEWRKEWLRFPRDSGELKQWTPRDSLTRWRGNKLLGVFDCTYVWLQTSSNVGKGSMRAKTYSSEQYTGQPFVKYLTFTAPNGRLMFYYGPFGATMSDNDILSQAIKDSQDLKEYLNLHQRKGLVLLDRGFNHTDQVFEKLSIHAKFKIPGWTGQSPPSLLLSLSLYPNSKADQSGKFSAKDIQKQYDLTSDRAVVEQFHGVWRRFVFFQLEVPMTQVPKQPTNDRSPLKDYMTVSLALANYFYNSSRS